MIAKNYIKFPEALRFQMEMFSNGHHNSPRIMRLVEVIFSWTPSIPQWWKDLKAAEGRLIKGWKNMQLEIFGKKGNVLKPEAPTNPIKTLILQAKAAAKKNGLKISLRNICQVPEHAWTAQSQEYRSLCSQAPNATPSHKRHARLEGHEKYSNYWGGFSG